MNYAGHEKLRAEVAEVANAMCDLRTTMNEMEQRYSFNADTLPERLVRQTLFRANRLLMEAYMPSGVRTGATVTHSSGRNAKQ